MTTQEERTEIVLPCPVEARGVEQCGHYQLKAPAEIPHEEPGDSEVRTLATERALSAETKSSGGKAL